ncbi:MAG TPA: BON domain-containing protein [Candidatus Baltobacteraceae bacterium]|nr:BON domain-containing protein [Candidatus Baltobacteraceae bacterium]
MSTKSLDLQEEVIEELAYDPRIAADDIAVTIKEGIVTLRGTVPTFNQKWEAEDAVKRIRGIRGIADELSVDLPSTHVRTDTDIALAIERRFASNTIVPNNVKFVVKDGRVTLSGEVPWYYQAQEAAYEARRVIGVRDVSNNITVKPVTSLKSDEIKRKIHSELQRMADLDAKSINVAVSDGTVTLSGSVRTWTERDKATQAAWSFPGVLRVENLIGIKP